MMRDHVSTFLGSVRAAFTENLLFKSVALLGALLFWMWVQNEQVIQERARVRLEWQYPDGMVPVEPKVEYVTVTLEGVQALMRGVSHQELTMELDLTSAREGDVNVDLTAQPIGGLSPSLRVISVSPQALQVRLDRLLRRRLPVEAGTSGEPAPGYSVRSVTVTPSRVEIAGPASLVRSLTEIRTYDADVNALREDADFQVGLDVSSPLEASPATGYTVSVRVAAVEKVRRFESVPVLLRGGNGWEAELAAVTVELYGPVDRVDGVAADQLSVLVYVPAELDGETARARRTEGSGLRFEVVHPGGDQIAVRSVEPAVIPLRRR